MISKKMQSQFVDCCDDQNINGEHVKHLKIKCSDVSRFNSSLSLDQPLHILHLQTLLSHSTQLQSGSLGFTTNL